MGGKIHVGTSGYHFPDWVGTVYPEGLSSSRFLAHYAQTFHAVEINTTYYRIPDPAMFRGMLTKVPGDFVFVVKTPQEMTHARARFDEAVPPFLRALEPVRSAGQLGGLLAQFPTSFRPGDDADRHLDRLSAALVEQGIPLHVEFRHKDWHGERTLHRLRNLGLGFVNVDLPRIGELPGPTNAVTTPVAYYRLHGRNARMWWHHPTPSHRYDYAYTDGELTEWAGRILEKATAVDGVFVFANNCHLGSSFVDALRLSAMIGGDATLPAGAADLFEPQPKPLARMSERIAALRAQEAPILEAWATRRRSGSN